ncbi:MAG TPA: hypothetical protein VEU62_24095 [Bryobacterales bacterium]|nr:hypothetical protein [Bryobacterales bacterium]
MILWCGAGLAFGQVNPAEIRDPQLKALEKTYLNRLTATNREIARVRFPFPLVLSRYVGLEPKQQLETDTRGLEFVKFHERTVLKVTGNYNAAYNAGVLTQNQQAGRVMEEVIEPALRVMTRNFFGSNDFSGFGFEISFHVRRREQSYDYEGKEILVVVLGREDASTYLEAQQNSQRQEILDRSEIYLNGKPYGLTLGERDPFPVSKGGDARVKTAFKPAPVTPDSPLRTPLVSHNLLPGSPPPAPPAPGTVLPAPPTRVPAPVSVAAQADAGALQTKYQSVLDGLNKEGSARFHFVGYARPEFVIFRNQIYLQMTLKNPAVFDPDRTSIYKRAAQSFDLFLAPALKPLLAKVPVDPQFAGLDITVLVQVSSPAGGSPASEALEFLCPAPLARRFADAEITNQELIDQSIVLVNGVRIALNLQQVE